MRVEDQKFKDWDHYKFTLWQSQLNFAVFCASSACSVSVEHLNAKEPMIRSIYRFHVYYHIRRILKILEIPLPFENSFNKYSNPYNHEKFIGICSEYGVSNDLTKWRNQKYFSTWQSRAWETNKAGMSYINENSFSRWIIKKSDGLTMLGLQKLSESVRDYAYLILTSQTSTRAQIIGHEAHNLDSQRVFLNTFENIVNRRVNIPEDIRRFQKNLQYARSKVDYVIGEFIYMIPSDMDSRIGEVKNFNNKILISAPSFKIGNNVKINIPEDIRRFQKNLQYTRSKADYVIGEFIYMIPSDMDSRIGEVKNFNNKILISAPSFKIGNNVKINLNGEKNKPDVKPKGEEVVKTKPNIESNEEQKQVVKMMKAEPDIYGEEKVTLVLGITSIFTLLWMFK